MTTLSYHQSHVCTDYIKWPNHMSLAVSSSSALAFLSNVTENANL